MWRRRTLRIGLRGVAILGAMLALFAQDARADTLTYWNLFNTEGESVSPTEFVTYASLNDMLLDQNRTGVFIADGFSAAVAGLLVGSGSDGTAYWNLGNHESNSTSAGFATYATLTDMLNDTNRTGIFTPDGFSSLVAAIFVDSGSDGTTYWNLANEEFESIAAAGFATYSSLADMLQDTNRLAIFIPGASHPPAAPSLVGTGSDGTTYWNVFNLEGEGVTPAYFATYTTLTDMLLDQNRTAVFEPNGSGAASRLVGTGAGLAVDPPGPTPVLEPGALLLFVVGVVTHAGRRRARMQRADK
jgi:hypothetical protein